MLNINKTIENGKVVLMPEGRLDTLTAPEMETAVQALLPGLAELTLDFEKLEYISSAGLRVLLSVQKAMKGTLTSSSLPGRAIRSSSIVRGSPYG